MEKSPILLIWIIATITSVGCVRTSNKQELSTNEKPLKGTGKLIPIVFSDTGYYDLQIWIHDTITTDGWTIKYLVRDDSTKYTDIYIECSKGNLKGIYYGYYLLEYRRYFIPTYIGETNSHIYFRHRCATECFAILTFAKDSTCHFNDYENVVDANINFGQILFVADSSYSNEFSIYQLTLVDLFRSKTHDITYNAICRGVLKPDCVDTVVFTKSIVSITTTLWDDLSKEKAKKHVRTVNL